MPESPTRNLTVPGCDPSFSAGRRVVEHVSTGVDEELQGVGGDPFGGISTVGLRVPALPTPDPAHRYLFMLASFRVPQGARMRVVGFRQMWTLGFQQVNTQAGTVRVVEQEVTTPFFKLPDGNVSWHIQIEGQDERPVTPGAGPVFPPLRNLAFEDSDTPALLYIGPTGFPAAPVFYTTMNVYTPPNAGHPWGRPLTPELGTFYDLKTPWRTGKSWFSLDIPVDGPARVAFFASVHQSDPAARTDLVPPVPFFPCGLSCEEQFLLNFPDAIIWRVAGALIVELEDYKP